MYCSMKNTPVNIAVCNQKGGIGKSTFTVLLASYLHLSDWAAFSDKTTRMGGDRPKKLRKASSVRW